MGATNSDAEQAIGSASLPIGVLIIDMENNGTHKGQLLEPKPSSQHQQRQQFPLIQLCAILLVQELLFGNQAVAY